MTKGVAGTTNRIADLAGVSIGSLYQYFPNKQAILAELALRHLAESTATLLALCDRFDAEEPDRDEMVTAMVGVALNGHHPRAHAVMRELAPRTPELVAGFAALTEVLADRMIPHLVAYRHPGVRRPDADPFGLLVASVDGQVHQLIAGASRPTTGLHWQRRSLRVWADNAACPPPEVAGTRLRSKLGVRAGPRPG